MSGSGTPTDPATIDALSRAARDPGDALGAQTALWRAMFGLEKWFFVARGTPPEVAPLVGLVDEVPSLLAFTTGARARGFARANGFDGEEAGRVLSVRSSGILNMCDELAGHGVQRLVVDQGTLGFSAPLGQLRSIHGFIEQQPPQR